ncbi:enolase-phosphatase E1-like [Oppia nitens]|uniref:enolase-phosphatase E1-like n=1 Tax=Oppia nitens TaxID=1686743 RepID=UPI0023D9E125|nr:enolase-phosphatase E1-like [Oppia nitens]
MTTISKPKAIVMDIEGTTTDIHFVSQKLFPTLRKNMKQFLSDTFDTKETKELIQMLREEKRKAIPAVDNSGDKQKVVNSAESNILWQMNNKLKTTSLKTAELLCWVWVYKSAVIKAHVYKDVSNAFYEWKSKNGIKLYVYSSGIISAQKLLFANTEMGNLHHLIDDYFDSTIGDKKDSKSYKNIASKIGVDVGKIIYITDSSSEATGAQTAGMKVMLIRRGKSVSNSTGIPTIKSFADIKFN